MYLYYLLYLTLKIEIHKTRMIKGSDVLDCLNNTKGLIVDLIIIEIILNYFLNTL